LILPRGMLEVVTSLAAQAGSRLNVTDQRSRGTGQDFTCTATLTPVQRDAVTELASIGNPRYQNLLNARRETCAA
jgi:hypothetical protein